MRECSITQFSSTRFLKFTPLTLLMEAIPTPLSCTVCQQQGHQRTVQQSIWKVCRTGHSCVRFSPPPLPPPPPPPYKSELMRKRFPCTCYVIQSSLSIITILWCSLPIPCHKTVPCSCMQLLMSTFYCRHYTLTPNIQIIALVLPGGTEVSAVKV